jgi:hypothetical protein
VQAPAAAEPPPFYAAISEGHGGIHIQIQRTATGQATAISPTLPSGWDLMPEVSAAADDRTFFTVATHNTIASGPNQCHAVEPFELTSRFYRMTVTATGRLQSFGPVGVTFSGAPFGESIYASPDGSRIAYTHLAEAGPCPASENQNLVYVMDLASGSVRSWRNTVSAPSVDRVTSLGWVSWSPDGRHLVVDYLYGDSSISIAVLSLDTSAPSGSIQAASSVVFSQSSGCPTCVSRVIAGPAGTLTAAGMSQSGSQYRVVVFTVEPTGQRRTLFAATRHIGTEGVGVPWVTADSSGRYVILVWEWEGGLLVGWIHDGTLITMPWITSYYAESVSW